MKSSKKLAVGDAHENIGIFFLFHSLTSFPNFLSCSSDERAVASSDYDSTYDSTYETNHSDSSDFAQNEEEGEGGKKPPETREGCREYMAEGVVLHPLLPSPEVS